jgi:chromate transporter
VAPPPAERHLDYGVSRRQGAVLLALCGGLLVALPALATLTGAVGLAMVAVFFKAGALVFGGRM